MIKILVVEKKFGINLYIIGCIIVYGEVLSKFI